MIVENLRAVTEAPLAAGADLERALVERLRADKVVVPPYPAVATKLQRLTSRDGFGIREVTPIVAADASLSAAVLRKANTAMVSRGNPIDSLEAAIFKLGAKEIVSLAIAQTVGQLASAPGGLVSLRRDQWRAALVSATLCQGLAPRRGVRPELAFMAGLLHDFGAIVVVACLEQISAERPLPTLSEAAWCEVVQKFHVDFGMVVAARWQLPEPLAEVMASHHNADAAARAYRPLVQLVAVVDQVVAALDHVPEGDGQPLQGVAGLSAEDRATIAALLPHLAETFAGFEASVAPAGSHKEVPSKVQPIAEAPGGSWPIDVAVAIANNEASLRACTLSPNAIVVRSPTPLLLNWLVKLTVFVPPDMIPLMVNVRGCDPTDDGAHLVTLQPFALAGPAKAMWMQLLSSTRPPSPIRPRSPR